MVSYFKKIYESRFFWFFLAVKEIKFKYRRSKLGGLWMMIQPLALTLILSFVFSTVFNQRMGDYALYVLSGLVMWDLITASFNVGGQSLISAEAYIRQFNHPKTIYSLKSAIVFTYTFLIELLGLILWLLLVEPQNLFLGLITLPLTTILVFIFSWEVTTIAAYTNSKYYDYPQLIGLALQAVYFVSPIFLQTEMFVEKAGLLPLYLYNPVTHFLNLIREPFLYGKIPSLFDYGFVAGTLLVVGIIAYWINKNNEKTIIFYI